LLGRIKIDYQLELRRLLDRNFGRLRSSENLIQLDRGAPNDVGAIRPVRDKSARFDPVLALENGRHSILRQEI
jgi:hypothetical protein